MADEAVLQKLNEVVAILQLAFRDPIEKSRQAILADSGNRAILEATATDWISAGELKRSVARDTSISERSVQRRIANLVALGALQQSGGGGAVAYKASGMV